MSEKNSHTLSCVAGGVAAGAILGAAGIIGGYLLFRKAKATSKSGKKVAVVLSGCGVYDGAEITESTSVLCHTTATGASVDCFAPNQNQMHVVDHSKGAVRAFAPRNAMAEAGRISRGNIKPLEELLARDYDAVIFPGGFGVAKNLSTWAVEGEKCTVEPNVVRIIQEFNAAKKPIGMCCIAPILAAKTMNGCKITVGCETGSDWPYAGTAGQVKQLGATHVPCNINEICIDETNNLVTAPAYMFDGRHDEVYNNVGQMVNEVLSRIA